MPNILIFGSCVSRDIFNVEGASDFVIADYYARSSLAALATPCAEQSLSTETIESPFQRRMVERDLSKSLLDDLGKLDFDLLLIDFIDERFDIAEVAPGCFATVSNEFLKIGGLDRASLNQATVRSGTPRHRHLWVQGLRTLVERLRALGKADRLVLNAVAWASSFQDGSPLPERFTPEQTERANQHLAWMHDKLRAIAPEARCLEFKPNVFKADAQHRWDVSPFHYIGAYHKAAIDQLRQPRHAENVVVPRAQGPQIDVAAPREPRGLTTDALRVLTPRFDAGSVGEAIVTDAPLALVMAVDTLREVWVDTYLDCGAGIGPRQALLQVEFDDWSGSDPRTLGLSRSSSDAIGWYSYVDTKPGRTRSTTRLQVPRRARRLLLRLRTWWATDAIRLIGLNASSGPAAAAEAAILLSVDVEALSGRADGDHVDRLILGRFGGREYGVTRLCDIFAEYGVRATFFVDYAGCAVHGDKEIFKVAEMLRTRGHDVQLHVHAEEIVRSNGWARDAQVFPAFSALGFSTARSVLEYCARKFESNLGEAPEVFRPGGLHLGPAAILAAQSCGIQTVSAICPARRKAKSPALNATGVFRWESGALEIPVDVVLDPLKSRDVTPEMLRTAIAHKSRPLLSLLMHSWSLLYRDPSAPAAHFTRHEPAYERTLRAHLAALRETGTFLTHREVARNLHARNNLPRVTFSTLATPLAPDLQSGRVDTDRECNICGALMRPAAMENDICGCCLGRTRHRVLKRVLDQHVGNVFEGRRVIANHAAPHELRDFLADAASVTNFDVRPLPYLDCVADVQDLSKFADHSFDVFYSVYVLNHVRDDRRALKEMRRVLQPDGFAVVMVPFRANKETEQLVEQSVTYGKEALEKYGVGSYRYYGLHDLFDVLREDFEVSAHFATDPITDRQDAVFICRPR